MVLDRQLVQDVLKGDRTAYGHLVQRYERSVRGVVLGVLGNYHAAEDAAQDVFIMAYEKLGQLRDRDMFGPWIMKIGRRHAVRMVKQRRRQTLQALPADLPRTPNDGQLNVPGQRLLAAVARLPKQEHAVVMLRHFDDHSMAGIAEMTGRPLGTVTKQLSRAHARLRRWLKEENQQ